MSGAARHWLSLCLLSTGLAGCGTLGEGPPLAYPFLPGAVCPAAVEEEVLFNATERMDSLYLDPVRFLEEHGVEGTLFEIVRFYRRDLAGTDELHLKLACLDALTRRYGQEAAPALALLLEGESHSASRGHILHRIRYHARNPVIFPYLKALIPDCHPDNLGSLTLTLASLGIKDPGAAFALRARLAEIGKAESFYGTLYLLGDPGSRTDLEGLIRSSPGIHSLNRLYLISKPREQSSLVRSFWAEIDALYRKALTSADLSYEDLHLLEFLTRYDDPRVPILATLLLSDDYEGIRRGTARLLGELAYPEYLDIVRKGAEKDRGQPALFWAMARCGDPRGAARLREILAETDDGQIYAWCVDALLDLDLGDEELVMALPPGVGGLEKPRQRRAAYRLVDMAEQLFRKAGPQAALVLGAKEDLLPEGLVKHQLAMIRINGPSPALRAYLEGLLFFDLYEDHEGLPFDVETSFYSFEQVGDVIARNAYNFLERPLLGRVKCRAMQALAFVEAGADAKVRLLDYPLFDADPVVRAQAARMMGVLDPDRALPLLMRRLEEEQDRTVREEIIRAIGKARPGDAVEALLALLGTDGERLDRFAVPAELEALLMALDALGRSSRSEAETVLQAALDHENDEVCGLAAFHLARLGEARGEQDLLEWVYAADDLKACLAIPALAALGVERIVPVLIRTLSGPDRLRRALAAGWLAVITGERVVFDPFMDPDSEEARQAVSKYRSWWLERDDRFELKISLPLPDPLEGDEQREQLFERWEF